MATIWDEVKVEQKNRTTDGDPVYTLNFDGVITDVVFEPTKEQLYYFKLGILSERERIWDESEKVADNKTMQKLLRMS